MPSAYSLSDGTERVPEADLICISFKEHIIHWLEQCRNVSREEMKPLEQKYHLEREQISPPGGQSGGIFPPVQSKKVRKYRTLKL